MRWGRKGREGSRRWISSVECIDTRDYMKQTSSTHQVSCHNRKFLSSFAQQPRRFMETTCEKF